MSLSNPRLQKYFFWLFIFILFGSMYYLGNVELKEEDSSFYVNPIPKGFCDNSKQGRNQIIDDRGMILDILFLLC